MLVTGKETEDLLIGGVLVGVMVKCASRSESEAKNENLYTVQGDQERPFLSRELRRGVLTKGEKRISRDNALVIEEERRGAVRGVCERKSAEFYCSQWNPT
jgi:hypothetical protein